MAKKDGANGKQTPAPKKKKVAKKKAVKKPTAKQKAAAKKKATTKKAAEEKAAAKKKAAEDEAAIKAGEKAERKMMRKEEYAKSLGSKVVKIFDKYLDDRLAPISDGTEEERRDWGKKKMARIDEMVASLETIEMKALDIRLIDLAGAKIAYGVVRAMAKIAHIANDESLGDSPAAAAA